MSRALGVWATKHEVYLAVANDGEIVEEGPQRMEAPQIMEANERLSGFFTTVRHALDEIQPQALRILQPEQIYQASYSEFVPRISLEAVVRLACDEQEIPVEILNRTTARTRVGLPRGGTLDQRIAESIAQVGKYWNAGRKYAALAALAEE